MIDIGIKTRVVLLALIPTLLVALSMSTYFVSTRVLDLDNNIKERGVTIANYVAQTSIYSLLSRNNQALTQLVTNARDGDDDILSVAIFTKNNLLLASSGTHEQVEKIRSQQDKTFIKNSIEKSKLGYIIRTPIVTQPEINPQSSNFNSHGSKDAPIIGYVSVLITNQNTTIRQYQTLGTALLILLIGTIIGGFLAQHMAKKITHPIINLANAVKKIKEGELNISVEVESSGELKTLTEGFNSMSKSLYEAREEMQSAIEQATEDLNATNTTLEEQNLELNIARRKAIDASKVKSEFLANMSHEIRTPMNGVIGFTNFLLKSDLTKKQTDYLSTIKRSANDLLGLIDNILDFSKIEAGKMELDEQSISIDNCVEDSLNLLAPAAQLKGLEFVGLVEPNIPQHLIGDAGRIGQILRNLCSNAIKFTQDGTIQIKVFLEEERKNTVVVKFKIIDTGIGLSPEKQKILFKAFTQADTTTTRRFGGTGLGLVISKNLVNAMDGNIGIESKENQGSTFWFTIKLKKDFEHQQTIPFDFPGKKALVHDANAISQSVLESILIQWGMQVESFDTLEGLSQSVTKYHNQNKSIHLVVVSGYSYKDYSLELAKLSQDVSEMPAVCAILVNTKDESEIKHYSDLGSVKVYSKPIIKSYFHNALKEWFNPTKTNSSHTKRKDSNSEPTISILCVDDNDANLKLIDAFLSDYHLSRTLARDGNEAVNFCKTNKFDLVFMDIQMPGMDGLQATKLIRNIDLHNSKMPIIALTAHAMKGEKERLLSEGMNQYLTKPISQEGLKKCIEQWTSSEVIPVTQIGNDLDNKTNELAKESSIDWELSLKNSANKEDLAKELLSLLVKSFSEVRNNLKTFYSSEERELLLKEVHKLHGATAYCGVPHLKKITFNYETQLKSEIKLDKLTEIHKELLNEIDSVEGESQQYL